MLIHKMWLLRQLCVRNWKAKDAVHVYKNNTFGYQVQTLLFKKQIPKRDQSLYFA